MKTEQELGAAGFTESGKSRFQKTVNDYSVELFDRSLRYGELDIDKNLEVTQQSVREAAYKIARSYGKERLSKWAIPGQIFEYIFTASAGIGGGTMFTTDWGTPLFVISLGLAIILIVARISMGAK